MKNLLRIGLIGSRGQLGQELVRRFSAQDMSERVDLHCLNRPDFDITDSSALQSLPSFGFDIILNMSAYNAVDRAEVEVRECFALNAFAPFDLARTCREAGAALLHVSSDYVMSGGIYEEEQIPFPEDVPPYPLSVYGLSKATGEQLVRHAWDKTWIIRTCGLYGGVGSGQKGGNFVTTMLRLAKEGRPIRVVSDQRISPTSTKDLANGIASLVTAPHPFGVWNLTNNGNVSWYEFARAIFDLAGLSPDLSPVTLAEYRPQAPRSPFSVLSNAKAHQAGIILPSWQEGLMDYLRQLGFLLGENGPDHVYRIIS